MSRLLRDGGEAAAGRLFGTGDLVGIHGDRNPEIAFSLVIEAGCPAVWCFRVSPGGLEPSAQDGCNNQGAVVASLHDSGLIAT